MTSSLKLITPDWPAPDHIEAFTTTRLGGCSLAPYDSLNLGDHVSDNAQHVAENRGLLASELRLGPENFAWLQQVHGTDIIDAEKAVGKSSSEHAPKADASFTHSKVVACTVMTADCLPLLFCDEKGTQVAAAHAGWRGLLNGVVESTVAKFKQPETTLVWLGPAIGPTAFEVGHEVFEAYTEKFSGADQAFERLDESTSPKYLADLYQLARLQLKELGVSQVYGGEYCTYSQSDLFYSFRRDGARTGRMASVIVMNDLAD